MDRYTQKNKWTKSKLKTQVLEEELEIGADFVNKLHQERLRLADAMEREYIKQEELRTKIEFLKAESQRLQKSNAANTRQLDAVKARTIEMGFEFQDLQQKKEDSEPVKTSHTIRNNFPELIVHLNRGDLPTEKSILLTCLGKFIRTMAENEFEEHNWTAKLAENRKGVAGRIRFDGVYMTEADVKIFYKPAVAELAKRFSRSGLSVQAKTKRQNGVVTVVDLTIRVPSKIREARLELP